MTVGLNKTKEKKFWKKSSACTSIKGKGTLSEAALPNQQARENCKLTFTVSF